jgi:diacylglycerol kinase
MQNVKRKSEKFSLKSRAGSFKFAFHGLLALLKNEHNSRIHLLAAVLAITSGFIFRIIYIEWIVLIIVIGLVFLTELINSSIEAIADYVNPEWNQQIKVAKDYAAAAVLVSAIISIVTGGIIFIPKILALFQ